MSGDLDYELAKRIGAKLMTPSKSYEEFERYCERERRWKRWAFGIVVVAFVCGVIWAVGLPR